MLKSHRSLCVSFSRAATGLFIYHVFVGLDLNFLHISQWIILPTQSCLVLYSFCANLLHSLIMWLMVPSQSTYKLHLLYCCLLTILHLLFYYVFSVHFFTPALVYHLRESKRHQVPSGIQDASEYSSSETFSNQRWQMVFHWSFSDSKAPQVYRTLLSILADISIMQ